MEFYQTAPNGPARPDTATFQYELFQYASKYFQTIFLTKIIINVYFCLFVCFTLMVLSPSVIFPVSCQKILFYSVLVPYQEIHSPNSPFANTV